MTLIYVLYSAWKKTTILIMEKIDDKISISSDYQPHWKIESIELFIDEFNYSLLEYKKVLADNKKANNVKVNNREQEQTCESSYYDLPF